MNNYHQLISIGTDMAEVARFRQLVDKPEILSKIFTDQEINDCRSKADPAASLAARFAAKEAIQKCLDTIVDPRSIEITADSRGRPLVKLIQSQGNQGHYDFRLSMTHTKDTAQAVCLSFIINQS